MAGADVAEVPRYKSHKIVHALQIACVEILEYDTTTDENPKRAIIHFVDQRFGPAHLDIRQKPTPEPGWFYVIYDNNYFSFSPGKEFREGYSLVDDNQAPAPVAVRDYGYALQMVKAGALMERDGWNGKGQFIFFVPGSKFKVNRHPLLGIFPEGTEVDYHGHIDLRNAQGKIVPWTPSQGDQLAEDWRQVERPAASGLAPHEQRVVDEKASLDDKIGKLKAFFNTSIYAGIAHDEQDRLNEQFDVMVRYSAILAERIEAF